MQSQDSLIMPGIKYAQAVALSFFHPKQGPIIGFLFPKEVPTITGDIQSKVSEIMDRTYEEGFYSHSFGTFTCIDYFFQIRSEWARGNIEMVVISTIFDEKLAPDMEYSLRFLSLEFAKELKEVPALFKGFYLADEKAHPVQDRTHIRKMDAFISQFVEKFYNATNEKISEKIFEIQMRSLSLFTEDDASPIRWSIGEEGVKILLAILRGATARKQIISRDISPETIRKHLPIILSLDLATEGRDIVLTNRGLKFLGLVGPDFDAQYKKFETHSFELIVTNELTKVLTAVLDGADTSEDIAVSDGLPLEVVKKWVATAFSYDFLSGKPSLALTTRGIRFLDFAKQNKFI